MVCINPALSQQLDLEMSFAKGEDVMRLVEKLVHEVYGSMCGRWQTCQVNGALCPAKRSDGTAGAEEYPAIEAEFPRMTYYEAMSLHGSDKPDLRIPNKVRASVRHYAYSTTDNGQRSNESTTSYHRVSHP